MQCLNMRVSDGLSAYMCLLRVYLEGEGGRRLIAENVAFLYFEEGVLRLQDFELREVGSIEGAEVKFIDALNSMLVVKVGEGSSSNRSKAEKG